MRYQWINKEKTVLRDQKTSMFIPVDESNRHYRELVKPWLAEGNEPAPPDPEPVFEEPVDITTLKAEIEKLKAKIAALEAEKKVVE